MGDVVNGMTVLYFRVNHPNAMLEKWWQIATGEIAIFVDSCCQYRTSMLAIPSWIVGAAPKKRNSKRSSANYH
jgi:hypothetical protein